jgi:outer membrane murein-binding lipoprotein Lpp
MVVGMEYISDILLGAGALAAAFYCVILSRKLNRLSGLDQELGTAIAMLSQQVDEMTSVLKSAQTAADGARGELAQMTERAETVAAQLKDVTHTTAPPAVAVEPAPTPPPVEVAQPPVAADSGGLQDGAPSLFVRHSAAAS